MEFEWFPAKNEANIAKHGIDFNDAIRIFADSIVVVGPDRDGEVRWGAIGVVNGREIAVFYTVRGERYRIISARRARANEREAYRKAHPGG
ncbi:MAG: BrnT family toxin [Gemmatimonadetes bacterium]|nr:BrnT family toxin [Gemmatimonadota bacterium]